MKFTIKDSHNKKIFTGTKQECRVYMRTHELDWPAYKLILSDTTHRAVPDDTKESFFNRIFN